MIKQYTLHYLQLAILAIVMASSAPQGAFAETCQAKASRMAERAGVKVISVSSNAKSCKIRLLIKSPNGAPKRKTVIVPK